jgi:hypothetical protein
VPDPAATGVSVVVAFTVVVAVVTGYTPRAAAAPRASWPTAQQRAAELAERLEHASEPEPVDAMLDFYADLSAASALCAATRSALVPAPRTASQVLPARLGRPYPRAQE